MEGHVPAVRLGVVEAPHPRVVLARRQPETAVGAPALEEVHRRVEHVHVVLRAVDEVRVVVGVLRAVRVVRGGGVQQRLGHVRDAEVVYVAIHRPGHRLRRRPDRRVPEEQ